MAERLPDNDVFIRLLKNYASHELGDKNLINSDCLEPTMGRDYLQVTATNGVRITIRDPAIVDAAKFAALGSMSVPNGRDALLTELFAKQTVYRGVKQSWVNYQKRMESVPTESLQEDLKTINASVGDHLMEYKQHLGDAIYGMLEKKLPYVTFEEGLYNMSLDDVTGLLVELSSKQRPAVRFMRIGGAKVLTPSIERPKEPAYGMDF